MRFMNQVAIVTGAGRGLGLAIARALATEGASVALFDVDAAAAQAGAQALQASGCKALGLAVDVTDEAGVRRAMDAVLEQLGTPTVLVNNAGIYPHIPLQDTSYEDWKRILATNLDGTFLCTRAVFSHMARAGYGRIVNLSSAVVFTGLSGVSAYAAAKAGVIGFTRVIASEGGSVGVTANAVAPGLIETEGVLGQIAEHFDDVLPSQAVKRRGQANDIATAVTYLASPEAGFVTGQTVAVNGGLHYL